MKNFHAREMKDVLILRNNIDNGALCNGILKNQNQQMPRMRFHFISIAAFIRFLYFYKLKWTLYDKKKKPNELNRKCNMLSVTWFELSPKLISITSTLKQMRYLFWLFCLLIMWAKLFVFFFFKHTSYTRRTRAAIIKQFIIRISLFNFYSSYFDIRG